LKNQEKLVKASGRPEDASAFGEEFSLSSQMDGIMELSTLERTFRGLKATLAQGE